ncbi:MAG: YgiT-type zinc finger domain-containing protein [Desulfobacteraceae bacterium IS3]|nr:MAG: YgiT-type zinc finger domain-containing protein [Desulfobacteraceae bacterium IS3]
MKQKKCNYCGTSGYEERKTAYLYSYKGNYLLAPDTPAEICLNCGMLYYEAKVLKEIERRFFAIQKKQEKAESYIEIPMMNYA